MLYILKRVNRLAGCHLSQKDFFFCGCEYETTMTIGIRRFQRGFTRVNLFIFIISKTWLKGKNTDETENIYGFCKIQNSKNCNERNPILSWLFLIYNQMDICHNSVYRVGVNTIFTKCHKMPFFLRLIIIFFFLLNNSSH